MSSKSECQGYGFSGPFKDLLEIFAESGIGIVQLPCPQLEFNGGLNRSVKHNSASTNSYRNNCKKMSTSLIGQIESYIKNSYHVVGIIGVEFSSTCGVHQVQNGKKNVPGKGVLMEEIEKEMQKKNFQVPMASI